MQVVQGGDVLKHKSETTLCFPKQIMSGRWEQKKTKQNKKKEKEMGHKEWGWVLAGNES